MNLPTEPIAEIHVGWLGVVFGILAAELFHMVWLCDDEFLMAAIPYKEGLIT